MRAIAARGYSSISNIHVFPVQKHSRATGRTQFLQTRLNTLEDAWDKCAYGGWDRFTDDEIFTLKKQIFYTQLEIDASIHFEEYQHFNRYVNAEIPRRMADIVAGTKIVPDHNN